MGRGINRQSTKDLQRQRKCTIQINNDDTCHYKCVQPIEYITPRVYYNVNYRLWVITICQFSKFINFNKSTTLVGNVCNGRGYKWGEAGSILGNSIPTV